VSDSPGWYRTGSEKPKSPARAKDRQMAAIQKTYSYLLFSLLQLPSTCEHRSDLLIIRVLFIFTAVIISQGSFSNLGVIGFQLLANFASTFTSGLSFFCLLITR